MQQILIRNCACMSRLAAYFVKDRLVWCAGVVRAQRVTCSYNLGQQYRLLLAAQSMLLKWLSKV